LLAVLGVGVEAVGCVVVVATVVGWGDGEGVEVRMFEFLVSVVVGVYVVS
jgi:hypothetical protein